SCPRSVVTAVRGLVRAVDTRVGKRRLRACAGARSAGAAVAVAGDETMLLLAEGRLDGAEALIARSLELGRRVSPRWRSRSPGSSAPRSASSGARTPATSSRG